MRGQGSPGRDLGHLAQILGQVERRRQPDEMTPWQHITQRTCAPALRQRRDDVKCPRSCFGLQVLSVGQFDVGLDDRR